MFLHLYISPPVADTANPMAAVDAGAPHGLTDSQLQIFGEPYRKRAFLSVKHSAELALVFCFYPLLQLLLPYWWSCDFVCKSE